MRFNLTKFYYFSGNEPRQIKDMLIVSKKNESTAVLKFANKITLTNFKLELIYNAKDKKEAIKLYDKYKALRA